MPGGIALPAVNTAARGSLNRPRLRPVRPAAAASVGGSPSPPRRPVRNQSRGRHHRTSIASLMADEDTNVDDLNVDDLLPTNDSAQWQTTVKRVSRAVVVIKTTGVRSFDTESAGSAYATGFVVDAARGLILTNRHVLRPGPVVAEAVFQNREEVPLRALYCDPVHDFAFFRFDPALLRFHSLTEVPLAPDAAAVGLEVRVVGNDSGEKLSILSATLARLDRDAPKYSGKGYNDFNTFYLQAASGTKGGSSGSPVIDAKGRAVGLNAGSKTKGTAAYYLPLHRVERALRLLRPACPTVDGTADPSPADTEWRSVEIPRGTFQTTFMYKGFDECRRLGLRMDTEAALREAQGSDDGTGALVVEDTTPGGPGEGSLEVGDVLVTIGGAFVTDFVTLEGTLDDNVAIPLDVVVERGGETVNLVIAPGNLHEVTPARLLEVCGGVVHALSYQQARNFQLPVGSVYVAEPGYVLGLAGVAKHAIITSLNNVATPDLDAFAAAYAGLEEGARVRLQYFVHAERHRTKTGLLHFNARWYPPPAFYDRSWRTGRWERTLLDIPEGTNGENDTKRRKVAGEGDDGDGDVAVSDGDTAGPESPEKNGTRAETVARTVEPSLCIVQVDIATVALADGVYSRSFEGSGTVIHHDPHTGLGLVVVDRNTVPVASCDILVSFAAFPCESPGKVEYLHPTHNFAIVSYDASKLPKRAADAVKPIAFASTSDTVPPLRRGDEVVLVGLSAQLRPMARLSAVTDATSSASIPSADIPRFRAVNEEVITLDMDFGYNFGGVLTDFDGAMVALWASYAKPVAGEVRDMVRGLPAGPIENARDEVLSWRLSGKRGVGSVRLLDAEFGVLQLAKANDHGVPNEWVERLMRADPVRRQALTVASTVADSGAAETLNGGDVVLTAGGDPVVSFRGMERAVAGADSVGADSSLRLKLLREGKVVDVECPLSDESCAGTGRLLHWAGCQLQPTHRPVVELGYRPTDPASGAHLDVFISRWYHGSPAQRYGVYALNWVASVNGTPTPDLDTFIKVTESLEDGSFVRLKLISLNARPKVLTVKLDLHYWPTWELRRTTDGTNEWERVLL